MLEVTKKLAQAGIEVFTENGKLKTRSLSGSVTPQIASLIRENKAELIHYLTNLGEQGLRNELPPIKPIAYSHSRVPLSFSQQRLWFIDRLQGGSPEYNMPMPLKVEGEFDVPLVTRVFRRIIERHEVLRTVYIEEGGETWQRICPMSEVEFEVSVEDVRGLSASERESSVRARIVSDQSQVFDLSRDLMLRVGYVRTGDTQGVLLFNMHHIASDGWSMDVLMREFFALYRAYHQGETEPLLPLSVQYADYAHWQRTHLEGEVLSGQLAYWTSQLADVPAVHSVPLDYPRPGVKQFKGGEVTGELPGEAAQGLLSLAQSCQLTPFMLLHGVLSLVLSRHSNTSDIVIGTPVANRQQALLTPLIGFFVNTLVLRVNTAQASLSEYFTHIRQVHLEAQSHQDVPFEQLVERLKVPRSTAHSPLFQIMLTTHTDYGLTLGEQALEAGLPGVSFRSYASDDVQAKFDLDISIGISEQGVRMRWCYDKALFGEAHIEQMQRHLAQTLTALSEGGEVLDSAPDALLMLSPEEVRYLVSELNQTHVPYPSHQYLHTLFEVQAALHPDAVAVFYEQERVSYAQLNARANRLAHYLLSEGVGPDTVVGVCLSRSVEMVVALLGILKAGGAWLPLEPSLPSARLAQLSSDAEPLLVLTQDSDTNTHTEATAFVRSVSMSEAQSENEADPQVSGLRSSYLAYVIYTSGSTGQPKGVEVSHRAIVNRIDWMQRAYELEATDRVLQKTPFTFDVSVWEFFWPLSFGGGLVVARPEGHKVPSYLSELMLRHEVSIVHFVPSMLNAYLQSGKSFAPSLRYLYCSGEALEWSSVSAIPSGIKVHNLYGPTEAAVDVSYFACDSYQGQEQGIVPIGRAIQNIGLYVLDESGQLLPPGAVGELYIGGVGLARGYRGQPALTEERFIASPFEAGERLYRTGDLVRRSDDGQLLYLGRSDEQVKLRGLRIEPGEIVHHLQSCEGIREAAVLVREDQPGDQRLVAYLVVEDESVVGDCRGYLSSRLPEYMVPSHFVVLESFPLTSSGKLDRKALPAVEVHSEQEYVAPSTATESTLVEIWSKLLQVSPSSISTTSNFFELGGHSLLCIRLVSEIRDAFGVEVSIQSVFDHASISMLSQMIEDSEGGDVRPALLPVERDSGRLPLSFAQQRLWFIDRLQGGSPEYNMPMPLKVEGEFDVPLVTRVFRRIIERHEVLRTVYIEEGGETWQRICPMSEVEFEVSVEDVRGLSASERESSVRARIVSDQSQVFDLSRDLMLRVGYVRTGDTQGVLLFNMHHIASDGWSMDVLMREFLALYRSYSEGGEDPLPALSVQYGDYAHWQRSYLEGEVLSSQLSYWSGQLSEVPAVHSLPLDYERPLVKGYEGGEVSGALSSQVAQGLLSLSRRCQLTPFMLLHGALCLLLSRHSNERDVVVGTPVANRLQSEVSPLIGFFVNTLVLRVDTGQSSLSEYFAHVRQVHLDAQSNQDVPFEQLVERLKVSRSTAHSPLFQIMLTTRTDYGLGESDEGMSAGLPGLSFEGYQTGQTQAKFDLDIEMNISERGVGIRWHYDVALFSAAHIEQLQGHLSGLLTSLSVSELSLESPLGSVSMLSPAEEDYLVRELNQTQVSASWDGCVHELFEAQALRTPDKVAVSCGESRLSYGQLNAKANQLSAYLRTHHEVGPDTLVGLCVERSLEMVIGILGILKAGGAYVPLDPGYPSQRLNYMISDAGLGVILSQSHVESVLSDFEGEVLLLDGMSEGDEHLCGGYEAQSLAPGKIGLNSTHLAYVIYTSGSTGQPKGVMVEHRGLSNTILDNSACFGVGLNSVFYQATSFSFDAATWVVFMSLIRGARLQLASNKDFGCELASNPNVTHLMMTPSILKLINPELLPQINTVIVGGEAMDSDLSNLWLNKANLFNAYGPTEGTICVTVSQITDSNNITIGKAISNMQLLVLDQDQILCPYGVPGELYIGGAGLARGYLNQPDLTEERFIANPYYDASDESSSPRLYRTGDIVRYLPDGNLAYMGRIDEQLKIRGFRIETEEIAAQLSALEAVDSALVMGCEVAGSQQLVGYVQPSQPLLGGDHGDYVASLKATLSQQLPEYMVPGILVVLEQWPLTPNGKVDKDALPPPQAHLLSQEYVAPSTAAESTLVEIWSKLLQVSPSSISTTSNFFELGGHSLLVIRLAKKIQDYTGLNVKTRDLFTFQTIRSQALFIDKINNNEYETNGFLEELGPQDKGQKVVYCVPGMACLPKDFIPLAHALNQEGFSVKGFLHGGLLSGEPWPSIQQNAEAFVKILTEEENRSPLILIGHSYGGAIVAEMSRILQSLGVSFFALILDTFFEREKFITSSRVTNQVDDINYDPTLRQNVNHLISHQMKLFQGYKLPKLLPGSVKLAYSQRSIERLAVESPRYLKEKINNRQHIVIEGDHFSIINGLEKQQVVEMLMKNLNVE